MSCDRRQLCPETGQWLGREGSNLRYRFQRPAPYHLATPQFRIQIGGRAGAPRSRPTSFCPRSAHPSGRSPRELQARLPYPAYECRWSLPAEQGGMQRLQTDLNHLGPSLGGEDLTTPYVSDARHWVAVYSELVEGATKMGVGPK